MKPKVITIDGPAASGKSSVSREIAKKLGWSWVSTGAFYRGLAYVAAQEGLALNDVPALIKLCKDPVWKVEMGADKTRVLWRGRDVSADVFSELTGERASAVSQLPEVRQALLQPQRDCAKKVKGLVAEGRDCGTVVFPDADLKVFLTASQEARAQRRAREQGLEVSKIQASQTERDLQDRARKAAPMQVPPGGRVLDTDNLTIEQAVEQILDWASLENLGQ